ncbi:MAG: hypothetical protein L6Q92_16220 [Phycisphaerae bacterium]|nr:hypothetical protein [Phycisphaerae bacterium]
MKKTLRYKLPLVAAMLAPMLPALTSIACVPTDSSMSADPSTLATQIAGQLLTFVLDFARQALAAFLL